MDVCCIFIPLIKRRWVKLIFTSLNSEFFRSEPQLKIFYVFAIAKNVDIWLPKYLELLVTNVFLFCYEFGRFPINHAFTFWFLMACPRFSTMLLQAWLKSSKTLLFWNYNCNIKIWALEKTRTINAETIGYYTSFLCNEYIFLNFIITFNWFQVYLKWSLTDPRQFW